MNRTGLSTSLSIVATALLAAVLLTLSISRGFYELTFHDSFFSLTLASCVIVFFHVRPPMEIVRLLVLAGVLVILQLYFLHVPLHWRSASAMLGAASLALLVFARIWSPPQQHRLLHHAFLLPLLFVLFSYAGAAPLQITGRLHPATLDPTLYAFDGSLGIQLSFLAGRLILWSKPLTRLILLCYYALPAALLLVYAQRLTRNVDVAATAFLAFFVVGPVGVLFYNLVPACGPIYLVGSAFPAHPASAAQLRQIMLQPAAIAGARNAFPSLHFAWALLAYRYSMGLPRWTRLLLLTFLIGTVIATLALGEHYFVDLVAALPFALMIEAGCALRIPMSDHLRSTPIVVGVFLIVAWAMLLRFGMSIVWISPAVPWMLIAMTGAVCLVQHRRLESALASPRLS